VLHRSVMSACRTMQHLEWPAGRSVCRLQRLVVEMRNAAKRHNHSISIDRPIRHIYLDVDSNSELAFKRCYLRYVAAPCDVTTKCLLRDPELLAMDPAMFDVIAVALTGPTCMDQANDRPIDMKHYMANRPKE